MVTTAIMMMEIVVALAVVMLVGAVPLLVIIRVNLLLSRCFLSCYRGVAVVLSLFWVGFLCCLVGAPGP